MSKILIDMNYLGFQQDLFALEKQELTMLIKTLKRTVAYRIENKLQLMSLHTDHDSAYH